MSNDRYARLRELFVAARKLDCDARAAYIRESCGDDDALREELASMLRLADETIDAADMLSDRRIEWQRRQMERVLKSRSADVGSTSSSSGASHTLGTLSHDDTVGRYRIRRRIASGGMGNVYEAEQDTPRRRVALKMVHTHRMSPTLMERLRRESEILGRLQHPGISQVYDAGIVPATGEGPLGEAMQPYFAMEFIDGVTLTKHCDREQLSERKRLELLALICDAVHYAHEKGVIHRDLKPDNILVDEHGYPKVLDFGIARMEEDAAGAALTMTGDGQVLGTIAYMAPEQMDASSAVTPRADVYALGVIGFELLSRRLPHDLTGKSSAASLKYLMHNDPPKLGSIDPHLAGDVQTIIDKSLERDPRRRYESAAALAGDIRRFLAHEPITARRPSATYVATKFIRRHRAFVGGVAAVVVVLLAGITGTTVASIRTERARQRTADALSELELVAAYQESQLALDPAAMGIRMYDDLIELYRKSYDHSGQAENEIEDAVSTFTDSIRRINFTTYAANTVEQNILDHSLEAIDEQFASMPLVRARLLESVASTLKHLGMELRALATQHEAVQIYRHVLGNTDENTLIALSRLVQTSLTGKNILVQSQGFDAYKSEYEPLCDEAMEGLAQVLGDDHPVTLRTVLQCAAPMYNIGDRSRAASLVESTVERANAALGPEHPVTIEAGLAQLMLMKGRERLDQSRRLYDTSLRALGLNDPSTYRCLEKLGQNHFNFGNYEAAREAYQQLYDACSERYGERHPATLSVTGPLATLSEILNQLDDAERLLERGLNQVNHSPKISIAQGNLAFVYYKQGRFEEAIALGREALRMHEKQWQGMKEGQHVRGAYPMKMNLALYLADGGKPAEGERIARDLLRLVNAPGALRNPMEVKALRSGSDLSAITRAHLGRAIYQQGRYEEAEEELLAAYDQILEERGPEHHRTNRVIIFLVDLYDDWHAADPTQGYELKADEWYEKLLPVFDRTKRSRNLP